MANKKKKRNQSAITTKNNFSEKTNDFDLHLHFEKMIKSNQLLPVIVVISRQTGRICYRLKQQET